MNEDAVSSSRMVSAADSGERVGFAIYDSFAERRFTGNVAGVVVLREHVPTSAMRAIAAELGAPTTGFALLGEPVEIRYFTPLQEIDSCGHVTIAIATALAERGIWVADRSGREFTARTAAGDVPIRLVAADGAHMVHLAYRPTLVADATATRAGVEVALGGVASDPGAPLEIVWTGLRHLMMPFSEPDDLSRLLPSREALIDLAAQVGFDTLCAFATTRASTVRMRDLCAPIGALEEPASGTTAAALGLYQRRHHRIGTVERMIVEQGLEMGRPSKIEVVLEDDVDGLRAWVGGRAIKTASGLLLTDQAGRTNPSMATPLVAAEPEASDTDEDRRTSRGVQIRRLRASDYRPVIEVLDAWWGGRHMADMLPSLFFEHFTDTSFVAVRRGELIGLLVGFVSQSRPKEAYIHLVGVDPNQRGHGLARRLYTAFFRAARERGCSVVRAVTSPANKGSIAFHRRMGFELEPGEIEMDDVPVSLDHDGPGQDRVLFMKTLGRDEEGAGVVQVQPKKA
jgi:PhzF family phenazine biosynthesis protein